MLLRFVRSSTVVRLPATRTFVTSAPKTLKKRKSPKRSPSAFNLFIQAELKGNTSGNATSDFTQAVKDWKTLSDVDKKKYVNKARDLSIAFQAAKKPKRPASQFARFVKENFPKAQAANPQLSMVEVSKLLASEWKNLDASAKEEYTKAFQDESEAYKATLSAWEARQ